MVTVQVDDWMLQTDTTAFAFAPLRQTITSDDVAHMGHSM